MQSSELDHLVQTGHDVLAAKYFGLSTGAVLFYDYMLTLSDEIEYFWSEKKRWTFWLFVVNRYFPIIYQVWQLTISYDLRSPAFNIQMCKVTSWYTIFTYVICALLAQIAMTTRLYAVTVKNITVAIVFGTISVVHLAIGVRALILATKGEGYVPPVPLDTYYFCGPRSDRVSSIAYTSLDLLYDFLAFSLIMFVTARSNRIAAGVKVQTLLDIIAKDATRYFLIIFTSHFVLEMTLLFGRETIQLTPGLTNLTYIPVMISRMMLSLRKAAHLQQNIWTIAESPEDIRL